MTDFRLRQWLLSSFGWILKARRQFQSQSGTRHDTHFPIVSSRRSTDMNHRRYSSHQRAPFLRRPFTTKRFTIMYPRNTDQHSVFTLASPSATWLFHLDMRGSIVNRKVLCLARYSSCQFQLTMNSYLFQLFGFQSALANYVQSSPFRVTSLMQLLERPHIANCTRSGLLTSMLTFD